MTNNSEFLKERCASLYDASGDAISWIKDARTRSEGLNRDAEDWINNFRRMRNRFKRLGNATSHPISVGVFGVSQAGKSYLISSLAANHENKLKTEMDGHSLFFLKHINPPGGGKEATGLVTRFTRKPIKTPSGFPVRLTIFSEADIIRILGNSYFNDFDKEKVPYNLDIKEIKKDLEELETLCADNCLNGVSEDDVVDIMDYLQSRIKTSLAPLVPDFWPAAIEMAPRLPLQDRARLFSPLWGNVQELTDLYLKLSGTIENIQQATVIYASLDALVEELQSGEYDQKNSIMNVDILKRLNKDSDDDVRVTLSYDDERPEKEAVLSRSVLAALTSEMAFSLVDETKAEILNEVDLLDFPGYRSRLCVESIEAVSKELGDQRANPVAELFLRAKVAYLFEQYTEDQEMNALIFCTPSDGQIDNKDIGPAIQDWVHITQGRTPKERKGKDPALIWCITKFDSRLSPKEGQTESNLDIEWNGMLQATLLERLGEYEWVKEWAPGQRFNNLFLKRTPGLARSIIETKEKEIAVLKDQEDRLSLMRKVFAEAEDVKRHFVDPYQSWDDVMALNDGGAGSLAKYLDQIMDQRIKLDRINAQIELMVEEVTKRSIGTYYKGDGEEAIRDKKKIAKRIDTHFNASPDRLGELLSVFQPDYDRLEALYLKSDEACSKADKETDDNEQKDSYFSGSSLIKLNQNPEKEKQEQSVIKNERALDFARAAFDDWTSMLRRLSRDHGLLRYMQLDETMLGTLVEEIIIGAHAYKLEDRLYEVLSEGEAQSSSTRERIVGRQILVTQRVFGAFLDMLGQDTLPQKERCKAFMNMGGRKLAFEAPPIIPEGEIVEIPEHPIEFGAYALYDWLGACKDMIVNNVGETRGIEISQQQHEALGVLLTHFKSSDTSELKMAGNE